jgi:phage terminase large subunit-like protein
MSGPTWISDDSPLPDPHGRGERAVDFIRRLKHPKSAAPGRAFELATFQARLLRKVYGDTDPSGARRIKTVFALIPRGARKTTIGAALALLHTIGPERVPGGYAVSVACDREQARIAFDEAVGVINMAKPLVAATWVRDSRNLIEHPKSGSRYYAASSEAKAAWGKTPTFALADELHAWYGDTLWRAIRTGMAKAPGSILWIISTAGQGRGNLAWDVYEYAKKVAAGEVIDPGFLPVLFEPGPEVDIDAQWQDEQLWHAVNPGLQHGFPDLGGLRQLAREAESRPVDRMAFQQYHLNYWSEGTAAPWLDLGVYDEGALDLTLDDVPAGTRCWLGVDLSATQDLTAICALFEWLEDGFLVVPFFFVPQEGVRRRSARDNVAYDAWAAEERIIATPGSVVDYGIVEAAIADLAERFRVEAIAIDRWNSTGVQSRLLEQGLPVVKFGMGFASMSPACKEVERLVLSRRLFHTGCPVLRWCLSNVAIEQNPAGDIKISKDKAREKVDGAVALAMAVGVAQTENAGPSVYEQRPSFLYV